MPVKRYRNLDIFQFSIMMRGLILCQVIYLLSLIAPIICLTFTVDTQSGPVAVVSEKFLSVALDCSNIEGRFSTFDLTNPNLTKLVGHLSPMYFRIGGTFADRIVFSNNETPTEIHNSEIKLSDITFLASDWLKVHEFTKKANVRLIFDLNSLLRNEDGTWNSENAEKMIKFSQENGIETDWELGNEPDLYHVLYNAHVDATQLGNDYKKLREILNKYSLYNSSYLVGADMFDVGGSTENQQYLTQFLQAGSQAIHAMTWHQYYFNGTDAKEIMFLSPSIFNKLEQRANVVKSIVNNLGLATKIWMGETSSASSGGAANMSDRFIGSFIWLDKLGLGAKLGMDVIIRQTIFHDHYALLDESYKPNPDWWVSVIHKKLVGTSVVSIEGVGEETGTSKVRLYAHCARNISMWGKSAVVVFGLNVDDTSRSVKLDKLESDHNVYIYELTSESSLHSQSIRLNGEVLNISPNYELPELKPKIIPRSDTYTLQAYSMVFWVFTDTNVKACE